MGGCALYQQASGPLHITDNYFYNNKHQHNMDKELPLALAAGTNAFELPPSRKRLGSHSRRCFAAPHSNSVSTTNSDDAGISSQRSSSSASPAASTILPRTITIALFTCYKERCSHEGDIFPKPQ